MSDITKVEYKVRKVTRYLVTRYEEIENGAGSEPLGEFDHEPSAYKVAYALCKAEHDRLGFAPGDERIVYPDVLPAYTGQAVARAS